MISAIKRLSIAATLLVCIAHHPFAQGTKTNIDPDADFKLAKELYQKYQYSLAFPLFKQIALSGPTAASLPVSTQLEARYYVLVCGLQINEPAYETKAIEYIELENNNPRRQMLSYYLGEYYFRQQNFIEAMTYYDKAGIDNLSNREIADVKFHKAYGYFTMQQFDKAKPLFNSIRQMPADPNYLDANYYYGFISFYDKEYGAALESFTKVEANPTYQKIVPYYIAEIYYFKGDKEKAITYGEAKLKQGGQYYDLQLKQLVGHAYFEKKEYAKAQPYLEAYVSNNDKVRREDLYELSYTYYETNQLNKAIIGFKELGGKDDSLAQNSMYLLADSYLKTGQKVNARSAFLFCAGNSSNPKQKEVSQFNYAKLSFEQGYPDIALNEFKDFLKTYPNSTYSAEAKELLVNVLANTNNYKEALALYESLGIKSETVKQVYPRMLYGRAVEYINDQQIDAADQLLTLLFNQPYNSAYVQLANFWKGEIALRKNDPITSVAYSNTYIKSPVTSGEVNITNARYNLGSANFTLENYVAALSNFEQVTRTVSTGSGTVEQDAFVRSADCYFMARNYAKAAQMYDAVIINRFASSDYALYQKALIAGAANRTNEKISLLQSLGQKYPASALIPDANMEIADTYISEENFRAALSPLNTIIKDNNATSLQPGAYLKLGISHFNLENNTDALANFKLLVSKFPNSAESDAAVDYIRNIFVENQQTAQFVDFMRTNGKTISYSEEDSLTYASANNRYYNNDLNSALTGYRDYLNKFADGRYALDASFNLANIYNGRKDFANAMIGYEYIADRAPNKYAEKSVLQAARISFFEVQDFEKAERYFIQLKQLATGADLRLEGMRGLLRAQYRLNKFKEAVSNAGDLLNQKGIATDDRMMANMVIAKNYQNTNQTDLATGTYKTVVSLGKSEFGAEARYQLAAILFQQNRLSDAEKAAFDVVNKAGSYQYWTTRAYILLGDIYWKQKDYFNSEATFKSVAQNSTIEELKDEAQVKLEAVVDDKNKESKVTN